MMSDIVERLRSQSILDVWHPMMLEAAAEIDKLRAALKPFAETAEWDVCGTCTDNDVFRPIRSPYNRAPVLRVAHLRAAAAALKETGDE